MKEITDLLGKLEGNLKERNKKGRRIRVRNASWIKRNIKTINEILDIYNIKNIEISSKYHSINIENPLLCELSYKKYNKFEWGMLSMDILDGAHISSDFQINAVDIISSTELYNPSIIFYTLDDRKVLKINFDKE
ncbi:MAG: hypothetical protein IB618_03355 [Candidatus Pacearchaeota archaeon]|nr:MAG: hypothetical protein IB618_03355 [Candidatus Pacearchaeota archaeon]